MIILNGKKFAKDDDEFTDSLFKGETTCVGYYKVNKKSITLFNHQKQKIGVINCHKVLCSARKLESGKWFYSLSTIKEIGEFPNYKTEREDIEKAWRKL